MKEVLSYQVMDCAGCKARTVFISGECSLGYDENVRAYVHDRYSIYLSGRKLRYFDNLPTRERKYQYLTKLINDNESVHEIKTED